MNTSNWIAIGALAVSFLSLSISWLNYRANTRLKIKVSASVDTWPITRGATGDRLGITIGNQHSLPITVGKIEACIFRYKWEAKLFPGTCLVMPDYLKHKRRINFDAMNEQSFLPEILQAGDVFKANWDFDKTYGLSREEFHGRWFVVTTSVGRFSAKIRIR